MNERMIEVSLNTFVGHFLDGLNNSTSHIGLVGVTSAVLNSKPHIVNTNYKNCVNCIVSYDVINS